MGLNSPYAAATFSLISSESKDSGVFTRPNSRVLVTGISLACQLSFTFAALDKSSLDLKISHGHFASEVASLLPHSGILVEGSQLSVSQPILACMGDVRSVLGFCSLAL